MCANRSDFKQPPWVMGSPKEVMDWIEASHPEKKTKKGKHEFEKKFLKNLHIKFDFNVEKKEITPVGFLKKISGKKWYEENFDLFSTSEIILRGLAKSKFRNLVKIVVDKKTVYFHPEKKSDLRKNIDSISDFRSDIENGKGLEITAVLADVERCTAIIRICKVHSEKDHSVDIEIKGRIRSDIYHTFLNYLKSHIGLVEE